jgi:Ca2+-binding EF-hand superfamily protein
MAATATSALRQLFNMFARPRPPAGALTMETPELLHFLRALGQAGSVEAACASLLARYGSREHAGALDFPAFELLVAQEALGPRAPAGGGGAGGGGGADTELARVFARADADGDGLLSAAEVAALLGADGKPVGDAEVAAVMEEAGASAEGKLSLAQFLRVNLIQTR